MFINFYEENMKLIDIPKLFHSYGTGEKFTNCLVCKRDLLMPDVHYSIEKAIRNYPETHTQDVIFEYAMCFECIEKLKDELSEESKKNITEYFDTHVNLNQRYEETQKYGEDFNEFISKCIVTGESIYKLNEYVLEAHCVGNKMALSFMPYMVSDSAMDEIANLLSNKTIEFLDGFMKDNFDYPPEFKDIFTRRLVLL
jgi:hypothetical protein